MIIGGDRTIYGILQESDKLCADDLSLHFIDEVAVQNTGLILAKSSNYTKAFRAIAAERLEEFSLALHKTMIFLLKNWLNNFEHPDLHNALAQSCVPPTDETVATVPVALLSRARRADQVCFD